MNTRKVLALILGAVGLAGLIMVCTSSELALAVYALSVAVCGLGLTMLYLQSDLERRLLGQIQELRSSQEYTRRELAEQKNKLVSIKNDLAMIEARQSDRMAAIEEQFFSLARPARAWRRTAAPLAAALALALLAYSFFEAGPVVNAAIRSVRARIAAPASAPAQVETDFQKAAGVCSDSDELLCL